MGRLIFEIPGMPGHKARHRTTKRGTTYTPRETAVYENLVKIIGSRAVKEHGAWQVRGQFYLLVIGYFPVPTSWPKERQRLALAGRIRPTSRPDWDNIGKIVSDALNGIAWHDDSMVVDGFPRKFYSETPRVEIVIEDITDPEDRWVRKG